MVEAHSITEEANKERTIAENKYRAMFNDRILEQDQYKELEGIYKDKLMENRNIILYIK